MSPKLLDRWKAVPDPNATVPKAERGLEELFTEIRATVDTETQIVKAVFPNPPVVMQVFLQRVFAQSVIEPSIMQSPRHSFNLIDSAAHGTPLAQSR